MVKGEDLNDEDEEDADHADAVSDDPSSGH